MILSDYVHKCVASLLACGINPDKTIIYQQSKVKFFFFCFNCQFICLDKYTAMFLIIMMQVPYHGQLAWIVGCYATMTQLGHMHQFKVSFNNIVLS